MTSYERKGVSICKEQAKEEKKCRLVEEKHIKCQQYRALLGPRIVRATARIRETHEPWRTIRRQPLGLSAVSHQLSIVEADSQEVLDMNQRFPEKFLSYGNNDDLEVLFSGVNSSGHGIREIRIT